MEFGEEILLLLHSDLSPNFSSTEPHRILWRPIGLSNSGRLRTGQLPVILCLSFDQSVRYFNYFLDDCLRQHCGPCWVS